jgi:HPt (histidine-containing phosphotransfer) domain-containing protein
VAQGAQPAGLDMGGDEIASLATLEKDMPGFVADLVQSYLADAPVQLAGIRCGLAAGSPEAVTFAAHSLKSQSAAMGAKDLATLCQAMEVRGRGGRLDGVDGLLAQAESAYRRLDPELRQLPVALTSRA